jgi:anti-sigma regulatory factor (Ser/Thr protein kinase)
VEVVFTVRLPVDVHSVPFARGVCRQALEHLRVAPEVVADISLALTEACANVVQHAGHDDAYEVQVDIDDTRCRIVVLDRGPGVDDSAAADRAAPGSLLERGRGIMLMEDRMDVVRFERDPEGRHRVLLEKALAPDRR